MSASGTYRTDAGRVRDVMALNEEEYPDSLFDSAMRRGHTIVQTRLAPHVNEGNADIADSMGWVETYAAAHYFYSDHAGVGLGATDPEYGGGIVESARELDVREDINVDHLTDTEWANGPNGIPSPYWTMAVGFDPTPERYLARPQHSTSMFHTG